MAFLLFETETTTRHYPVPRTSELAFGLDLSPRAKGERSWQRGTTRNSTHMWRWVPESNPGHFDGNKRSALSSMPQLLFAFCGIQVFISWNSSFRRKNQVCVCKRNLIQNLIHLMQSLHKMDQVFVNGYELCRRRYYFCIFFFCFVLFVCFFFQFLFFFFLQNYKLQITSYKLQTTNYKLQITIFK